MKSWGLGLTTGGEVVVRADDRVKPLSALLADAPPGIGQLLPDWDGWCDRIDTALAADDGTRWTAEADVTFGPPLRHPPAIYACGANYYDHVAEMQALTGGGRSPDKATESVFHFLVSTAALTGSAGPVRRPRGCTMLDYEVELAAIIGRGGEDIDEADALGHVAGYTVVNDVSLRDPAHQHPIFGANFLMAKSQRSMKPMGPVIVPARFVPEPGALGLSMRVNGEVRQDGTTATMIWSLPEQIAALSRFGPLRTGDIIMTGTPAGTSAAHGRYLADGDVMEARVEGIGTLRHTVVAA